MTIQSIEQLEAEVAAIREARRNMEIAADMAPTLSRRHDERDRARGLWRERSAAVYAKVVHLIAHHNVDAKAYCLAAAKLAERLPEGGR